MKIDYTKLNNRIVEQAHEASKTFFALDENQKEELFRGKVERAEALLKSRDIYHTMED
jgi:isopenicillin N synthase-like dioxygenase